MRITSFYWQWRAYRPLPDLLMTRSRAAGILQAWRRAARGGFASIRRIVHGSLRGYLVQWKSGENAGMFVQDEFLKTEHGQRLLAEVYPDPIQAEERFNLAEPA